MPNTRLGKVSVTPKGDFLLGTAYDRLDIVYSDADKASYLAKRDNKGVPLTDRDSWMPLAQGVQGIQGIQGEKGEPFQIQKSYADVAEMEADFANGDIRPGQFVVIDTGDVDQPDNGGLYRKGASAWEFVIDMSGPTGAQGPKGDMPTIQAGAVTTGQPGTKAAVSIDPTDTGVSVSFTIPEGEKGSPLKVAGSYDTLEELEAAFPDGDGENSYLVSGIIHVWDKTGWKGTGGVDNYEVLRNKPRIGGVDLAGDKTLEELGIQSKTGHVEDVQKLNGSISALETGKADVGHNHDGVYVKSVCSHTPAADGNVTVSKGDVGLSNVDNVKQYSASNPPPYPVTSVAGRTGAVTLSKSDVGLSYVDNTSDINKPISTATQTALNAKANTANPTFTGTVTIPEANITGNVRIKGTGNYGNKINFGDGDYVAIFEETDDVMSLKGTTVRILNGATEVLKITGNKAYYLGTEIGSDTAANLLTKIKTVDGSNSGLDADLLDGQHGSYYASASHSHNTATASSSGFMSNTDKSKLDGIAAGATNDNGSTILSKIKSVDGSNSGLDADLLDGWHASNFATNTLVSETQNGLLSKDFYRWLHYLKNSGKEDPNMSGFSTSNPLPNLIVGSGNAPNISQFHRASGNLICGSDNLKNVPTSFSSVYMDNICVIGVLNEIDWGNGPLYMAGTQVTAIGCGLIAAANEFVCGRYNKVIKDNQFIVGNGVQSSSRSNAFRISSEGKVYGTGSYNSSGADYAEMFEWLDGNANKEDRRGLFVVLDGEKIRLANQSDRHIIGAVSACPSVVGDNHADDWKGKYKRDIFGAEIWENGKRTLTDDFDPLQDDETNPYIPLENRPEWDAVGLMGKLIVCDDGTCEVNGFCTSGDNGIATKSDTGYQVMKRVDNNHIRILIK